MAKAIANAVVARERIPSELPTIRINGFACPMLRVDLEQAIAKELASRITRPAESFVPACSSP